MRRAGGTLPGADRGNVRRCGSWECRQRGGEVPAAGERRRDVDFTANVVRVRASYCRGQLTTPKSGKVRAVPLAPSVAAALARRLGLMGSSTFIDLRNGHPSGRTRLSGQPGSASRHDVLS
jgi:hypothetical protein